MSPRTAARRDAADRLLASVTRLLPARRRAWGTAMRAELAAIDARRDRWRFALGCTRVAVAQPTLVRGAGYPLLMVAVVAVAVLWTRHIAYAPLRWGLVGLVAILMAAAWSGRRRSPLGPVGGGRAARLARAGGYALIGGYGACAVVFLGSGGDPHERLGAGVPIFAVVLTTYLAGILAVTARGSAATARVLAAGAGCGLAAVAVWATTVLLSPPIPANTGLALLLLAAAMVGAATLAGTTGPAREPPRVQGRAVAQGLLAALIAGVTAALLTSVVVAILADLGPAWLIPDLAPAALTPADDLANSRIEVGDPYMVVLFLGFLVALFLTAAAMLTRERGSAALSTVE